MKARSKSRPPTPMTQHADTTPSTPIIEIEEDWTDLDHPDNPSTSPEKNEIRMLEEDLRAERSAHQQTARRLLKAEVELEYLLYQHSTPPQSRWCSFFTCCLQPDTEELNSPTSEQDELYDITQRRQLHVNSSHR